MPIPFLLEVLLTYINPHVDMLVGRSIDRFKWMSVIITSIAPIGALVSPHLTYCRKFEAYTLYKAFF